MISISGKPLYSRQALNSSDRSQLRITTDYALPLNKGITFSAGLLSELQLSGYDYLISDTIVSADFMIPIVGPETQFDYENFSSAASSSIKGTMKNWFDYEAGLRLAVYHYNLEFDQKEFNASTIATHLIPSLHISRGLKEKQRFVVS